MYGNDLIAEWYCKDTTVQQGGTPNGPPQQRIEPKKGKGKAALKNILSTLISSLPGLAPAVTKGEIPQDEKMAAVGITLAPVIHEGVDRLIDKVDEWIGPGAAKIGEDSSEEPYIDSLKFFVKDHLGNVRVTYIAEFDGTAGAGAATHELQSAIDYYPYGKQLRAWFRGEEERFQSTLHERDAETGLDMRGARYYDSDYGRFLSLDPRAADFMAWSPYVYAIDNPVVFFDPNGLTPENGGDGDQTGGGDPPQAIYKAISKYNITMYDNDGENGREFYHLITEELTFHKAERLSEVNGIRPIGSWVDKGTTVTITTYTLLDERGKEVVSGRTKKTEVRYRDQHFSTSDPLRELNYSFSEELTATFHTAAFRKVLGKTQQIIKSHGTGYSWWDWYDDNFEKPLSDVAGWTGVASTAGGLIPGAQFPAAVAGTWAGGIFVLQKLSSWLGGSEIGRPFRYYTDPWSPFYTIKLKGEIIFNTDSRYDEKSIPDQK